MLDILKKRLIPILLLENGRLVKTINFSNPRYLGDPLNALRIFNEKCADEIIIIDKSSSASINFSLLDRMVGEAFMPLSYIGGVRSIDDFEKLFDLGVEKVGVNQLLFQNPSIVELAVKRWGQSSIFGCVDVKNINGKYHIISNKKVLNGVLEDVFSRITNINIGEIIIQNIGHEGTFRGLDQYLISRVKQCFTIPIISSGGAQSIEESLSHIENSGISGVAAGSMFSFYGERNAVLITYNYSNE